MNLGDWQLKIEKTYLSPFNDNRLYLFRDYQGYREFVKQDGTTKVVTRKEGHALSDIPYFAELSDDQLQAIVDGIVSKGVKTTNDHKNEGLLEATKYHLEDMRKLALKGNK